VAPCLTADVSTFSVASKASDVPSVRRDHLLDEPRTAAPKGVRVGALYANEAIRLLRAWDGCVRGLWSLGRGRAAGMTEHHLGPV